MEFSWRIGGAAGEGIKGSGKILSLAFVRAGYNVFDTSVYPSLIRGGHNYYTVRVSDKDINCHENECDLLVALNNETFQKHFSLIKKNGLLVFDPSQTKISKKLRKLRSDISVLEMPLVDLTKKADGPKVMQNTVALGATVALTGLSFEFLESSLSDAFGKKSSKIAKQNIKAAKLGFDFAEKNSKWKFRKMKKLGKGKMIMTGNEATALGLIAGGMKLYAAYPMTPASSILHYIAAHEIEKNIIYKQTEDEIAAIHTAIGANFTGVRAAAGTSGGGFSLMTEGLGLAAMLETPLVLIEAMRPGPSTGLPTQTSQTDLNFVLYASQGEFARIVVAPGDAEESFYIARDSFNLAERFQVPVIILTDKHVAESNKSVLELNLSYKVNRGKLLFARNLKGMNFKRFAFTKSGVSPRTIPGQKFGIFKAPSSEHDDSGWIMEDPKICKKMMEKRLRKRDSIEKVLSLPNIYGSKNADITFVCWGSMKGAVLDALPLLKKQGIKANLIHYQFIEPFKMGSVKLLKKAKKLIGVEQNHDMQFGNLIRMKTGIAMDYFLGKYSGHQFTPKEIVSRTLEALK